MTDAQERSLYRISLTELEQSVQVPFEKQVTEQSGTNREPVLSEAELRLNRINGIERAG